MHQMELRKVYQTGAEHWTCPECGRSFVMIWQPFTRVLLKEGDEDVTHGGSKGGLQITARINEYDPEMPDELKSALEKVLAEIDFGDFHDK